MYIGICGKQGSGKSSLSKYILDRYPNYLYIDIDKIGHEVNDYPEVQEELVKAFGDILTDNKVDRKKLGRVVFNNKSNMDLLEEITWKYMEKRIDEIIGNRENVIFDWLLLPKTKYFKQCNLKVLWDIDRDIRLERITKRDNITEEYFNIRENSSYQYTNEDFDIILKDNNYVLFNDLDNLFLHKNYWHYCYFWYT